MSHPLTEVDGFGYEILNRQLKPDKKEEEYSKFALAFKGDFWQDGRVTVLLPEFTARAKTSLQPEFQKRYVTRNALRECVERVSNAILGKNPNWLFQIGDEKVDASKRKRELKQREVQARTPPQLPIQPDPEAEPDNIPPDPNAPPEPPSKAETEPEDSKELQLADEVNEILGDVWTGEALGELMIEALNHRLVQARGGLRIYVPAKFNKGGQFSADDLKEAMSQMRVEFIEPVDARFLDDDSEEFSLVRYEKKDNWETEQTVKLIEFSFVDDDGLTFIGIVREGEAFLLPGKASSKIGQQTTTTDATEDNVQPTQNPEAQPQELSEGLELGGATTFKEMRGRQPFVTDQLFQNNQLLNLALTLGGFNLVDAGFGEMVITNVDLETEKVPDPNDNTKTIDVAKGVKRGGSVVNNLIGVSTMDMEGKEAIANPGVYFREPSSIQVFDDGAKLGYTMCLDEAGQRFILISGDAGASGESRIQAMVDFYLKVKKYKPEVDKFGSWLLTTLVKFAALICGRESEFENFKVVFDAKIVIAKLTADERRLVIEMQEKGVISMETARVLLDVDDPDLEQDLIDQEKLRMEPTVGGQPVTALTERTNVANSMAGAAPTAARLRMMFPNMSEAQIQAMLKEMRAENAVDEPRDR